jgi:hypothetical protein
MAPVISAISDALPPYRKVEGVLVDKEAAADGRYTLLVAGDIVEVDRLTFETLMVGEALRIRCTRGMKAINIDRLVP